MKRNLIILITACFVITSCKKNDSNQSIAMTMVHCSDGSYYYTSQNYISDCEKSSPNYLLYNVPVKASIISVNNSNYRKFDLTEKQIDDNLTLQSSLAGYCTCSCSPYRVVNNTNMDCSQVCAIICDVILKDKDVQEEIAINQ